MEATNGKVTAIDHVAPLEDDRKVSPSSSASPVHAEPEVIGMTALDEIDKPGFFAYLKTKNFYLLILLGYVCLNENIIPVLIQRSIDKFWRSASRARILSPRCFRQYRFRSLHFKHSGTTFF